MSKKEKLIIIILIITSISFTIYHIQWKKRAKHQQEKIDEINYKIDKLKSEQELMALELDLVVTKIENEQKIRLTSYYPNDPDGSGTVTASGLSVSDFTINDKGWFEYQGMLVVACATPNYKEDLILPTNYRRYKLGSVITMVIDKKLYKAIVCDICGASYWNEDLQRYDLYVSNNKSVIDTEALIIIKEV